MKKMEAIRIVFMGTPAFAVASLEALVYAGCNIVAVVTSPDKPAGRGLQLQQSAVKQFAVTHNLPVLQPEKLKNPAFLNELKLLKADLQVVVAFRMLPEVVWNMPPMGSLNLHGSILPQYRGAAPINWAIINGEIETGVTTFKLKHEIDTGDILLQEKMEIGVNETAGEVHDRMKVLGASLLLKTLKALSSNAIQELPQLMISEALPTQLHHAPKIFTDNCKIDFSKTTAEVHNLIRGLSPFPGAFTYINGKMLKIYKSEKEITPVAVTAIENYYTDGKSFLKFACSDGYLHTREVQLEGKKKMLVEDFLKGFRQQLNPLCFIDKNN